MAHVGSSRSLRLATVASLLLALCALPSASSAGPISRGFGMVMQKNVTAGTLQIDDSTFIVASGTTFTDLEGNPTSFEAFYVFDTSRPIFPIEDATLVEFVAEFDGANWRLRSVKRIRELPN